MAKTTPLQEIAPDEIKPNPENPRLIFREEELIQLMENIRQMGIRVPLSVYLDGSAFYLIDGERRWKCARRLNLKTVPAIVQPKPSRLDNLLMMFNIHNVRVDWDLMPMALKLGQIRQMLLTGHKPAEVRDLAALTGVSTATVRRALDLLEMPKKFQDMLVEEAKKPKAKQTFSADLFIEVYKSLHTVERHAPEVFKEVSKKQYVDAMVDKYTSGVVDNVVAYRSVSKMARAELAGVNKKQATPAVVKLVKDKSYSIAQAFNDTVQAAYEDRDLQTKVHSLTARLSGLRGRKYFSDELAAALLELRKEIDRLLNV